MKLMVIYDNTGKIWAVYDEEETTPSSLGAVIAEAPEEYSNIYMDMSTNPPTVVFVTESDRLDSSDI